MPEWRISHIQQKRERPKTSSRSDTEMVTEGGGEAGIAQSYSKQTQMIRLFVALQRS